MSGDFAFQPFPFITGGHAQTLAASFLCFNKGLPSTRRMITLSDGEKLALEITTPDGWKESDPTAVMVHGLCGSHRSTYMVRLGKKLVKRGMRVVRLNLRGCGSGRGHGKKMYHSEASDDVWQALKELHRVSPNSPMSIIGFSLGGNIILKMAGERGEEGKSLIDRVISVNPPVDMASSVLHLSKNKVYERFFMGALREEVAFRHEHFDDLPPIRIPEEMTLPEFDELYIAPQSGQRSANDYYHACSSARLIHQIAVPCHILFSKDDPIVDCHQIDPNDVPSNVEILITEQGGHLGFLSRPSKGGLYWMDHVILKWLEGV